MISLESLADWKGFGIILCMVLGNARTPNQYGIVEIHYQNIQ